jgi:hypothetical protein
VGGLSDIRGALVAAQHILLQIQKNDPAALKILIFIIFAVLPSITPFFQIVSRQIRLQRGTINSEEVKLIPAEFPNV